MKTKKPRKRQIPIYSEAQQREAVAAVRSGLTYAAVAKQIGCSGPSVANWMKKAADKGEGEVRTVAHWLPVTDPSIAASGNGLRSLGAAIVQIAEALESVPPNRRHSVLRAVEALLGIDSFSFTTSPA